MAVTRAVDPERPGDLVCHLTAEEMNQVDAALQVMLALDPRWR